MLLFFTFPSNCPWCYLLFVFLSRCLHFIQKFIYVIIMFDYFIIFTMFKISCTYSMQYWVEYIDWNMSILSMSLIIFLLIFHPLSSIDCMYYLFKQQIGNTFIIVEKYSTRTYIHTVHTRRCIHTISRNIL